MYITYRIYRIYIIYVEHFYVNKLIKAEAESFLESFSLGYPIYIYIYRINQ